MGKLLALPAAFVLLLTAAAAKPFPLGTYTTTITAADVPANMAGTDSARGIGTWEVTFRDRTHLTVRFNGHQVVSAHYSATPTRIHFGSDSGPYACHSAASYRWRNEGTSLVFTRIHDTCRGRRMTLTAHPWTKTS